MAFDAETKIEARQVSQVNPGNMPVALPREGGLEGVLSNLGTALSAEARRQKIDDDKAAVDEAYQAGQDAILQSTNPAEAALIRRKTLDRIGKIGGVQERVRADGALPHTTQSMSQDKLQMRDSNGLLTASSTVPGYQMADKHPMVEDAQNKLATMQVEYPTFANAVDPILTKIADKDTTGIQSHEISGIQDKMIAVVNDLDRATKMYELHSMDPRITSSAVAQGQGEALSRLQLGIRDVTQSLMASSTVQNAVRDHVINDQEAANLVRGFQADLITHLQETHFFEAVGMPISQQREFFSDLQNDQSHIDTFFQKTNTLNLTQQENETKMLAAILAAKKDSIFLDLQKSDPEIFRVITISQNMQALAQTAMLIQTLGNKSVSGVLDNQTQNLVDRMRNIIRSPITMESAKADVAAAIASPAGLTKLKDTINGLADQPLIQSVIMKSILENKDKIGAGASAGDRAEYVEFFQMVESYQKQLDTMMKKQGVDDPEGLQKNVEDIKTLYKRSLGMRK